MYNILLVDDHAVFRKKIKRLSCWKDHPEFEITHEASNGADALEYLYNNDIQVVITDIKMPIMDGIELLKQITSHKLCPCVVLLSEYAEFEYARQGLVLGALDYIVKPVTDQFLNNVLIRIQETLNTLPTENDQLSSYKKAIINSLISKECPSDISLNDFIHELNLLSSTETEKKSFLSNTLYEIHLSVTDSIGWLSNVLPDVELLQNNLLSSSFDTALELFQSYINDVIHYLTKYTKASASEVTLKACTYILENPFKKLTLTDVAAYCFVNNSYLSHIFKQELQISLIDYINNYKMDISKQLITSAKLNITEIAAMLGYDSKYFGRIFKEYFNVSPSNYKRTV